MQCEGEVDTEVIAEYINPAIIYLQIFGGRTRVF